VFAIGSRAFAQQILARLAPKLRCRVSGGQGGDWELSDKPGCDEAT